VPDPRTAAGRMPRGAPLALMAALASALALAAPSPAVAESGRYTVATCAGVGGLWDPDADPGWSATSACATDGSMTLAARPGPWTADSAARLRLQAPAGLRIGGVRLDRAVTGTGDGVGYALFADEERSDDETSASPFATASLDAGRLTAQLGCEGVAACAGEPAQVRITRADVDLLDDRPPVLTGAPAGALLDASRPVRGTASIAFAATDAGGGVYSAAIEVDGQVRAEQVADPNGGRCAKPFTLLKPCKAAVEGTIALDTNALPDGAHRVRLLVRDATETLEAASAAVTVTVDNVPDAGGVAPTPNVGTVPVRAGTLTAAFSGSRRSLRLRFGRRARVEGYLVDAAGRGLAGRTVTVTSRDLRDGARAAEAGTVRTASDGRFAFLAAPGPSRRLRFAAAGLSAEVMLRVQARAALRIAPARLRVGQRMRARGALLGGGIPRSGVLVEVQAMTPSGWRTIATVRSDRRGAFSYRYRFTRTTGVRRYTFRVRIRQQAAYPYATGYSSVRGVVVRGS